MLDQLLAGRDPQELFARDGLLDELKKALSERMLTAEPDDHLESEEPLRRLASESLAALCRHEWATGRLSDRLGDDFLRFSECSELVVSPAGLEPATY